MTLDRRKVLIYLRPDISASERFADAKIEAHHRGDRGDMSRTALLAGLALGEVDSRLPSMLAALLAEDTKPETLRKMLAYMGPVGGGTGGVQPELRPR
ncbi:plasmid partitioning/stability family protein, partial [Klebsiella pneumoniae]